MTAQIELSDEAALMLDFEKCPTIRGRIEIKRKAMAAGYMKLVGEMLTRLLPPHDL